MKKLIFRFCLLGVPLLLQGCVQRNDVELLVPDLSLDIINPSIMALATALPKNPRANSFLVQWNVVPDKNKPEEALPHSFLYDRSSKTLTYHHSMPFYELYSGVTDQILQKVAAQKGGARMLLKDGCSRTFPKEN